MILYCHNCGQYIGDCIDNRVYRYGQYVGNIFESIEQKGRLYMCDDCKIGKNKIEKEEKQ